MIKLGEGSLEANLAMRGVDVPSLTRYYLGMHLKELELLEKKTKDQIKGSYVQDIEDLKDTIATLTVSMKKKEFFLEGMKE